MTEEKVHVEGNAETFLSGRRGHEPWTECFKCGVRRPSKEINKCGELEGNPLHACNDKELCSQLLKFRKESSNGTT